MQIWGQWVNKNDLQLMGERTVLHFHPGYIGFCNRTKQVRWLHLAKMTMQLM
jgi:hypothetical protein